MLASRAMKKVLAVLVPAVALLIGGCSPQTALLESFVPEDTKTIIQRVAKDVPLPENASVSLNGTVITGSGNNWVGRIELVDQQTPGELMRFFVNGTVAAGWSLTTTTIARTITLTMERNGRKASILIDGAMGPTGGLFGIGGSGGDGRRSRVTISVNHEGAVEDQTPFRILTPAVGGGASTFNLPTVPPTAGNLSTETALLGLIATNGAISAAGASALADRPD